VRTPHRVRLNSMRNMSFIKLCQNPFGVEIKIGFKLYIKLEILFKKLIQKFVVQAMDP